ncbi:MAG: exodeoxyribonuclease V subunit gamma, partial [Xanthomonadales bacterium]|nr:exodeoxyribonuclease V subunit gamma [Xanthomonadales bacterium]
GLLARPDPAQMLAPQTVLVPQPGLQRWLVQRLAEKHGIAANLEFIAPAQLVWRLLRASHADLPKNSAFDREVLRWRLLKVLSAADLSPALAELVGADASDLRRFELAGHLAQLYERYQGYRRTLLQDWEGGAEPEEVQAQLWRQLTAADATSRSHLLGDFLAQFTPENAPPPPGLPTRLFAFGIINVSPDVLRVLGVGGRHVDLHFFMPTPCREYWGDIPDRRDWRARMGKFAGNAFNAEPNPLLVSLGGVGREFVELLFAYDEVQPDFENDVDDAEPPRTTLLQRVQADVITQSPPDRKQREAMPDARDDSLHVHVCHSPLREVQVLHDQLLDLLQRDEQLQPRDIAVMVPDLARYAPCVEAVFGALGHADKRRIPWTVADRPASETHALVALFLNLLDLPTSRLSLTEVLDVLAVPAVMRCHDFSDADLERVAQWLQVAGVRWGEDGADRVAHGLPAFEEYSWRFGRRRLLLGYMSGAAVGESLLDGMAPLSDLEGSAAAALGAVFALQSQLTRLREELRQPQTPDAWVALFNNALEQLLAAPEGRDEERAMQAIRDALKALVGQTASAAFADSIDWISMRAFIHEQLRDSAPQQSFLAGGVSVCGLVPLRNVPFKVICILGLDAEAFPRRDPADALNRLYVERVHGERQLGDRSLRDDDRYLFLQTLMSARETLYLSYTGIDMRDGKAREPSVILSELLDSVCEGYFTDAKTARECLLTQHPMQPFSRRLFEHDAKHPQVFTYRHEWQAAAQSGALSTAQAFVNTTWSLEETITHVELSRLRYFFRNPAQAFLRTQVGLALAGEAQSGDLREPLVLDRLQQYQLDSALVAFAQSSDAAMPESLASMRAMALLPPLDWGRVEFEQALSAIAPQLEGWRRWRRDHASMPSQRFVLELGEGRLLHGVLDDVYAQAYAGWVGKANNRKGLLSWWIGALVAVILDESTACLAFGCNDKSVEWRLPRRAAMPSAQVAREHLRDLFDAYAEGQLKPLPLPPRTGFAYAAAASSDKPGKALASAQSAWDGGYNSYAESSDRWFALAMRGRELFDDGTMQERFETLSRSIYMPMCQALLAGGRP